MRTNTKGQRGSRWAFMEGFEVNKNDSPYLNRLRLIQTPLFGVYLHRIHQVDLDRDPHDHPWWFGSLVLSGSYVELVHRTPGIASGFKLRTHKRGSLHVMSRNKAHRIVQVDGTLWTLVLVGPRRSSWSFWTANGPVDWREYLGE